MNFNRVFHYKPSILGVKSPYFWVDTHIPIKTGGVSQPCHDIPDERAMPCRLWERIWSGQPMSLDLGPPNWWMKVILLMEEILLTSWGWLFITLFARFYTSQVVIAGFPNHWVLLMVPKCDYGTRLRLVYPTIPRRSYWYFPMQVVQGFVHQLYRVVILSSNYHRREAINDAKRSEIQ